MPLLNYFTTSTLSSQCTWQSTWETLQTGFATMTGALWQGAQAVFNPPEEPFFMQVQEEESYQVYSNWCSEVRRAERLLQAQLAKKQLFPEGFRKALLAPLADLSASMVSPLYYYLRLKKLEQTLAEKNYPKAFKEVVQEAEHRLQEALKAEPELARNYFYQDILNHLIELSAQRFSASKLLGWMKFYVGLVEKSLYQSVKQALKDFIKTQLTGEIAAGYYKKLIAQLNGLFQATIEEENSVETISARKNTKINYRFLALAGLALTGGYAVSQINLFGSGEQNGLTHIGWQNLGIIGTSSLVAWTNLGQCNWNYPQSCLTRSVLIGGLSTFFPLTYGQAFDAAFELSNINGTNGFVINGVNASDYAGYSIASGDINGDGIVDVLIGAPFATVGNQLAAGVSYVAFGHRGFFSSTLDLSTLNGTNGFIINGVTESDCSGFSLASGDVNGDNITDVLIGAPGASPGGRSTAGISYVVFGHKGPFSAVFDLSNLDGNNGFAINGVTFFDFSGRAIASGDINRDGKDDVLIGAPTSSGTGFGASYVVFGHTGSFPPVLELSALNGTDGFAIYGVNPNDYLGYAISSGDINGDGAMDVLIGAYSANYPIGAAYVVFGYSGTFPAIFELSSLNGTNGFAIAGSSGMLDVGWSIASGDINRDGKDDVLIGARETYLYGSFGGASYVVYGHSGTFPAVFQLSTLDGTNGFIINAANINDNLGYSIASGDINYDGIADVLIGANFASPGDRQQAGTSYVVFGQAGGILPSIVQLANLNSTYGFAINGVNAGDNLGCSIFSGDIDGNGADDVLVGALNSSPNNQTYVGAGYVIFGLNITTTPNSSVTPSPRANSNHRNSKASNKTPIAVGVTLGMLGLFAVGGIAGYQLYQKTRGDLTNRNRRKIEQFMLINDIDKREAHALYKQTGIRVVFKEGQLHRKVVLGKGEFGKVKLAYDLRTKKFVGVKKIKGSPAINASLQERLIHEKLTNKKLSHILPILSSVITEDSKKETTIYQFISLAGLGDAEKLRQKLAFISDIELKRKIIQHVSRGLLQGIVNMHNTNICHLDLKPQNYIVTNDGMIYVIDFGFARDFESNKSCWIDNGGRGDTSCFSPERMAHFRSIELNNSQKIGPASEVVDGYDAKKADAWSVGLALLELILGRYPLSDDNKSYLDRLRHWDTSHIEQLLEKAYSAVEATGLLANQQGQELFELIKGLLSIDPNKRLTLQEALNHSLFSEAVFAPSELKLQFQALCELETTNQDEENIMVRRDEDLYSATVTSRTNDLSYADEVQSMAMRG